MKNKIEYIHSQSIISKDLNQFLDYLRYDYTLILSNTVIKDKKC